MDWLPEDDIAYFLIETVEALDLSAFDRSLEKGSLEVSKGAKSSFYPPPNTRFTGEVSPFFLRLGNVGDPSPDSTLRQES